MSSEAQVVAKRLQMRAPAGGAVEGTLQAVDA